MKTAIDKNETYFQRLKRESFEWLEKLEGAGRTVPPFIHLALTVLKEGQSEQVTDLHPVDLEQVMSKKIPQIDINTPFFGNSGAKIPTYKHNIGSTTDFKVEQPYDNNVPSIEQPQPEKTAEEIYKKVFIHAESDLPKVKGEYSVHRKIAEKLTTFVRFAGNDIDYENKIWMRSVDWYLQPIDGLPSDINNHEEIDLIQHIKNLLYNAQSNFKDVKHDGFDNPDFDKWVEEQTGNIAQFKSQSLPSKEYGVIDIAKWLNEKGYRRGMDVYLGEIAGLIKSFVDEMQPTQSFRLTDREIKKACPQELIPRISCWIQGAKWYRDMMDNNLKQK